MCVGRVQQRFVEQNFETPHVVLVEVWLGSGGAVLRRDQFARAVLIGKLGHRFYELLSWQTLAFVSCDSRWKLLEKFLAVFYVRAHTDPEVDSPFALGNLDFVLNEALKMWQSSRPGCVSLWLLDEFHAFFCTCR